MDAKQVRLAVAGPCANKKGPVIRMEIKRDQTAAEVLTAAGLDPERYEIAKPGHDLFEAGDLICASVCDGQTLHAAIRFVLGVCEFAIGPIGRRSLAQGLLNP